MCLNCHCKRLRRIHGKSEIIIIIITIIIIVSVVIVAVIEIAIIITFLLQELNILEGGGFRELS